MLINPEPKTHQKEKASSKEFDTEDVKIYSLRIPTPMFDKLKHEIGRETKLSMIKAIYLHFHLFLDSNGIKQLFDIVDWYDSN